MKKVEDKEPKNKNSYAYYEWLKRDNIRQLRKAGHKADNLGNEPRKRDKFAKPDDSKIRTITSKTNYAEWIDKHRGPEPIEANPDLWEQNEWENI